MLRVNLREPRLAAFIAGLVGLAAGAGFSGLLMVYMIVMALTGRAFPIWPLFIAITGGGLAVEGGLLAVWVACGKRIRRLGFVPRLLLACGCWLLTIVNFVVFAADIH